MFCLGKSMTTYLWPENILPFTSNELISPKKFDLQAA